VALVNEANFRDFVSAHNMIAYLTLEIRIEGAQSLKDKRQVVRSVKDGLRTRFNVAVAEIDPSNAWQRATLGVVSISSRALCRAGGQQQRRGGDRLLRRLPQRGGIWPGRLGDTAMVIPAGLTDWRML